MFLTSFADILFSVGYRAYLPTLVGREADTKANSILSATEAVAEIGAFGLAGWLVQWLTAPIAIALDSVSFVFSAVFLGLISKPEETPDAAQGFADGARNSRTARIRSSMIRGCSRLPRARPSVRSRRESSERSTRCTSSTTLGFRPGPLGMIYATGGAASFVGAALTTRTTERLGIGRAMAVGLAAMGLGFALLTFAHGAGIVSIALLVGQQLIGDSFGTIYFVTQMSFIQQIAPSRMLGRVVASVRFLGLGAGLVGALLGALIGNLIGLRYAIAFGSALLLVAAAIITMSEIERGTLVMSRRDDERTSICNHHDVGCS